MISPFPIHGPYITHGIYDISIHIFIDIFHGAASLVFEADWKSSRPLFRDCPVPEIRGEVTWAIPLMSWAFMGKSCENGGK